MLDLDVVGDVDGALGPRVGVVGDDDAGDIDGGGGDGRADERPGLRERDGGSRVDRAEAVDVRDIVPGGVDGPAGVGRVVLARGVDEDVLDIAPCEVGAGLEHERDGAGAHGRGGAGAAEDGGVRAGPVIGGDDRAAEAATVRQAALAEMRDVAEQFVRVRSAATLLQWAIERYRREKQAPLLKRAGQIFATLTDGSFSDLLVEFDEQDRAQLAGLRPNGELVRIGGLSTGTTDQLYLALRVASVEDYLARADALPFVADDLFINFDNNRAAAGFKVLGQLAHKTQILFFTHHRHLVEIAQAALGQSVSVVSLIEEPADSSI